MGEEQRNVYKVEDEGEVWRARTASFLAVALSVLRRVVFVVREVIYVLREVARELEPFMKNMVDGLEELGEMYRANSISMGNPFEEQRRGRRKREKGLFSGMENPFEPLDLLSPPDLGGSGARRGRRKKNVIASDIFAGDPFEPLDLPPFPSFSEGRAKRGGKKKKASESTLFGDVFAEDLFKPLNLPGLNESGAKHGRRKRAKDSFFNWSKSLFTVSLFEEPKRGRKRRNKITSGGIFTGDPFELLNLPSFGDVGAGRSEKKRKRVKDPFSGGMFMGNLFEEPRRGKRRKRKVAKDDFFSGDWFFP